MHLFFKVLLDTFGKYWVTVPDPQTPSNVEEVVVNFKMKMKIHLC